MFTNINLKIKLFKLPADLRYRYYRLQYYIGNHSDPEQFRQGTIYVFLNKHKTLNKLFWFDGTGFCLYTKRLEEGTYSHPKSASEEDPFWVNLTPQALQLLLEGIDLKQGAQRAWYER